MIAFSGLDGAGKSTQIELVKKYWEASGNKVFVFWSRGGYTPGMERLKSLLRKKSNSLIPKDAGISKQREQSFTNPVIRRIWLTLAILDLIFYYAIYIRAKESYGTKIICDRYIHDTLIDFKLNFPQENVERWGLWMFMTYVSAKPKKHFVITIHVEESQRRSKLKNEPFPDTEETLKKRLKDYLQFAENNTYTIHIDGSKGIDEIHKYILEYIV